MIQQRLSALRKLLQQNGLAACIIPGNDPHASEYMAPHWMEMTWISGFLGETGTMVVTLEQALLWTDSRYYLQAETELEGSTIQLMRESDVDCPTIEQWLIATLPHNSTIGVNAEMYSVNAYNSLQQTLALGDIQVQAIDLIAPLWTENRPDIPQSILYEHKEEFTGESATSKIQRLREQLRENRCEAMVISALDEIGWLLNIRGADVDYTPCVIAYVVVEMNQCTLFVDAHKLDDAARAYLQRIQVAILPYEEVFNYLQNISANTVLYDGARVNARLYQAFAHKTTRALTPSPVMQMMSVKNTTQLNGIRQAMKRDAVALTRFFYWLDNIAVLEEQTEITLSQQLQAFRAQGQHYMDDSFCTIAGFKGNGAIVHYHATPDNCAQIHDNAVLLLDSGGQYLDGTTDITRTVWIGKDTTRISQQLKHDFTLVLKGHIALARAKFPKGTRGNQLDILARQFMWAEGINYGHGTGHGVGHFMGCHEGPQNIRMDNNPNPLCLGNICSDEPGIYRTNQYGIRTENLIAVVPATENNERSTGETYYQWETLTLCFYDTRLIDINMLTPEEIDWINAYHQRVAQTIMPLLDKEHALYLQNKCTPIK